MTCAPDVEASDKEAQVSLEKCLQLNVQISQHESMRRNTPGTSELARLSSPKDKIVNAKPNLLTGKEMVNYM